MRIIKCDFCGKLSAKPTYDIESGWLNVRIETKSVNEGGAILYDDYCSYNCLVDGINKKIKHD